ncbi:VirC2 family conjugal transfer protein [Bradyrhizobium algeriense]|uniref:VirC2 family conjugal transfer protein n=1 Tax=Bradyrhizobium algeriense TaxID=634784 RepID=UPI000D3C5981|nr:VirC2 family conjugal transfer protein [Bradyrhizobium algeriense]
MGIRKPSLSVEEAKQRAAARLKIERLDVSDTADDSASPQRLRTVDPADPLRRPSPVRHRRRIDQHPISTVDALRPTIAPETIQVFLWARPPAPEVSPIFDSLSLRCSPVKSLQMILRRALDDYETMLKEGSFRSAPKSYPILDPDSRAGIVVQTSRMFPIAPVQVARTHFDPIRLETARTFGHKLATAALACFFAAETQSCR